MGNVWRERKVFDMYVSQVPVVVAQFLPTA
jgi:hypothetical protein